MKRENVSRKLRFEIFKRDSFTCQYCGRKAPDVVLDVKNLEADHIVPVCMGGETHILNLVTACFDCNRGKSGNPLSDNSVVERQRRQMEELEERRQQIEMQIEWHKSLTGVNGLKAKTIIDYINDLVPVELEKEQQKTVRRLVKKYQIDEFINAIDSAFDYYKTYYNGQELTNIFIKKLSGTLINQKKEREDPDYSFVNDVYKINKHLSIHGFEFNFKKIEKMFKMLRTEGIIATEAANIMCSENWKSVEELSFHVNSFIKTPEISENKFVVKPNKVKLAPPTSSFEDILQSWFSYYHERISTNENKRKECFLVLLANLTDYGYKKEDITISRKEKIIRMCVNPHFVNKIKLKQWIYCSLNDLEFAINTWYGISLKVVQNSS